MDVARTDALRPSPSETDRLSLSPAVLRGRAGLLPLGRRDFYP